MKNAHIQLLHDADLEPVRITVCGRDYRQSWYVYMSATATENMKIEKVAA